MPTLAKDRALPESTMWHPDLPLQMVWDATSFQNFCHCPRYYYYTNILGYKTKKESFHLTFGRYYHSALEVYDEAIAKGCSQHDAEYLTTQRVLTESHGWESEDSTKTRFTLWRTVAYYMGKFPGATDTVKTLMLGDTAAIELRFMFPTNTTYDGANFLIGGYVDGLIEFAGQHLVRERKSTGHGIDARYWQGYKPNIQIDTYYIAGQMCWPEQATGVMVDAAQVTKNFSRFGRNVFIRSSETVDEYFETVDDIIKRAVEYAEKDYWPMTPRHCYACAFAKVCGEPKDFRQLILDTEYKLEDWDPTIDRTEV